jgi:ankyrin repeat protein
MTLNPKDAYGLSPLEYAAIKNDPALVKLLMDKGARLNGNESPGAAALWQACVRGHPAVAELLIDRGVAVNTVFDFGAYAGWTPLMTAAEKGHLAMVKILLQKGGDPNRRDKKGQTALMIAEANGQLEISEFLKK